MVAKRKRKSRYAAKNIYILIALILFNLMFVLNVWISLVGIILGLIAGAFALIISGPITLLVSLFHLSVGIGWMTEYVSLGGMDPIAIAFLSVAIFCFGGLWMIVNYYIVKYFYKVTEWYVKLNIEIFENYGN